MECYNFFSNDIDRNFELERDRYPFESENNFAYAQGSRLIHDSWQRDRMFYDDQDAYYFSDRDARQHDMLSRKPRERRSCAVRVSNPSREGPHIVNDETYLQYPAPGSREFPASDFGDDPMYRCDRFEDDLDCGSDNRHSFQGRIPDEFLPRTDFWRHRRPLDGSQRWRCEHNNSRIDGRDRKYQGQPFNGTVNQLNQQLQVYLPPPPGLVGNFGPPPPNNMFRGRGNWRHYHQNHFSHERDDRPYRRRRSHLDDIYLPNYEDFDDPNESEDVTNHQQSFNNRGGRWNGRHRIPQINRDSRKRCLISTKTTSTSKDCGDDKDKLTDSTSNAACVVTKTIAQANVAKKSVCDNDPPTDESDKITGLNMERCSNESGKKCEITKAIVASEDNNESIEQTRVVVKISDVRDDDAVVVQHETKTEANNSEHCADILVKPESGVNSVNSRTSIVVEETIDSKQIKTDDQSATPQTSSKGVDLDSSLEDIFADPFVVVDSDKSPKDEPSKITPICHEPIDEQKKALSCQTLPSKFPTWEQAVSTYRNPLMSVREIDSDEETICYDFITVDSIDTTKSYIGVDHLDPDIDDCRVVDMMMATPSPVKRKNDEDYDDVTTKKAKYDLLYDDINSDQILMEINAVLMEDKQNSEIATSRCVKKRRSKSLTVTRPKKEEVLPRCKSLHSIDQHHEVSYNFDLRTNLLELLGGRKSSSSGVTDDSKCTYSHQSDIVNDTNLQNDAPTEKLDKDPKNNPIDQVHEQKEKDIKKEKEVKEEVNGKVNERNIEIDQLSKESETNQTEDEVKLVKSLAAPISSQEAGTKGEGNKRGQTKDGRTEKSIQEELSHDRVSRESGPKKDADLKNIKSHGSTDKRRNVDGSSDRDEKNSETRTIDETRKVPENKSLHTDDNRPATTRYSDYKKCVGITKVSASPEMSLLKDSPKKLSSGQTDFSNNNLRLKFKYLFGSEDDEMDNDERDSKKRKCETDVTRKRESHSKKPNSESNEQPQSKVKSLDKTRRHSTLGPSTSEGDCEASKGVEVDQPISKVKSLHKTRRHSKLGPSTSEDDREASKGVKVEPPISKVKSLDKARRSSTLGVSTSEGGEAAKGVEFTRSSQDRQSSNNSTQKTSNSAAADKPKQPSDPNKKNSQKSKQIDKNKRRTSTPATSSGGNKYLNDKRRTSTPPSSVPQVMSTQKTHKAEDDKRKNSKHSRGENSPRHETKANTSQCGGTPKDEKVRLNIDKGKSRSHETDKNTKDQEKQIKSRTNSRVVIENITEKCHSSKDEEDKTVGKNNKPAMPIHDNQSKCQKDSKHKDPCEKGTPKATDNVQEFKKQPPAIDQKLLSHSKGSGNTPTNLPILQPQLVLSRIDDQIASQRQKELPIKTAIDSFDSEPNYWTCTTLAKDPFPTMQKVRFSFAENESGDTAAILESPEVSDEVDTVRQQVFSPLEQKESCDDVIEIKPHIPVIDLTEDGSDVKDEIIEPAGPDSKPDKKDIDLRPDEKVESSDTAFEKSKTTNGEETITLYRSDETLNNSLEVQAMVASISPQVLNNDGSKKPDEIKSDEEPVEIAQGKTTAINQAASTVVGVTPIPVSQNMSIDNLQSLTELLIEKAIDDAISQRDQQISSIVTNPVHTSLSTIQHATPADADRNPIAPRPNLPNPNPINHSPRRENDTIAQNFGSNQIPRSTERNAETQTVFTATQLGSPQHPFTQVSSNATTNTYRTPRSTDGNSPPVIYDVPVGNHGSQGLNPVAPCSTCNDNQPRVDFNTTENGTGSQNYYTVAQIPVPANGSSGSSNEPNIFVTISNSRVEQSVNEQTPVSLAGGQNNVGVDGPLRALHQLANSLEDAHRETNAIGQIVSKHLYYYDGLKRAQLAYSEQLKKMNRCLPDLVREELAKFESDNDLKFRALCKALARDLVMVGMTKCHVSRIQEILDSVHKAIMIEAPDVTKSLVYLMLENLMKPELEQYMKMPFLAALYDRVFFIVTYIKNHTRAQRNLRADQNSLPARDLFTPEQRQLLEWQLQQYKIISTNQVLLFTMENNLQSSLLRAHQNNQLNKANKQNNQVSTLSQQNNAPRTIDVNSLRTSVGNVRAQLYDISGPPNVSLSANNIPTAESPPAPQQASSCESSSTKTTKRPSKASATSSAAKKSNVGAQASPSVTVLSDITFNSTITAPTPRPNQLAVPSNVFCPTPRAIANTPRRNSSPSRLQFKPTPPRMGAEGTNDTFRIRLPFTMPYDVRLSPRATVVTQHLPHSTVQNPPQNPNATPSRPAMAQYAGATPSRASTAATMHWVPMMQNSGVTPSRSSLVQSTGATLPRTCTVQNSGLTPSRPSMTQNPDATPSRPSTYQNPDASPSRMSMISSGATPSRLSMVQNSCATPPRHSTFQNPDETPSRLSMILSGATQSRPSMVQNSGATPSRPSISQNPAGTPSRLSMILSGATPSRPSMVQNYGATPSVVQNPGATPHLSMPLLDDDVPSLSHIQNVMPSPVYAPTPFFRPIPRSPSPPLEDGPQPSTSDGAALTTITIEDEAATHPQVGDVPSTSEQQSHDEDTSEAVKNEREHKLTDGTEIIDLTWLDDVDLEQLQNEIKFIAVKKEEAVEEEVEEEGVVIQEPIGMALSPTDSGISSPNAQVEYNEQVFLDRTCICGKAADYVCGCRTAMYCSESCQLQHWKSHKAVCMKHNPK